MPRYFFNVFDGADVIDEDGTDLPDMYVAQAQAIRMSGELLREMGVKYWDGTHWRMEVSNIKGKILFVLQLSAHEYPSLLDP